MYNFIFSINQSLYFDLGFNTISLKLLFINVYLFLQTIEVKLSTTNLYLLINTINTCNNLVLHMMIQSINPCIVLFQSINLPKIWQFPSMFCSPFILGFNPFHPRTLPRPNVEQNHFKLPRAFESRLYQVCQGFISLTETHTPNPTLPTPKLDCVPKPLI